MSYQGARARPLASEAGRVFEVSRLRFAADGRISAVGWIEVDPKTDRSEAARAEAPLADVLDALHDGADVVAVFPGAPGHRTSRRFVAVEHEDGSESIRLEGADSPGRKLRDLPSFDG